MSMLPLRDYQAEAIEAIKSAWGRGVRRPAIVLPTGAGKTVVFAHLVAIMHERGVKSLILAHRDELIEQAVGKLAAVAPYLKIGVYKATRREVEDVDVIVASVQSLARAERRAEVAAAGVRLVIVDECHHAVADTYMAVLRELGTFETDPLTGAYAVGVTATMGRGDRVALGQAWQEVAYQRDIVDLIRLRHLVNAKGIRVRVDGLDLRKVARTHGDYRDGALAQAMRESLAPAAIARAYVEHAKDRQGISFAPTVELAYEMSDAYSAAGIESVGIDGAMPLAERRARLAAFARGDVQLISNCLVLTEGFDAPWCSAVVIARPTSVPSLFVQMAGRALRPHPGKADALVLDVAGVTGRHRLASVVDLMGADRVEALPEDLAEYDEIDLLDLDERVESGAGGMPREPGADGPLTHEIVDLFGTRRQAWLRTMRGVWFLAAGDALVFLAPDQEVGRYVVARCHSKRQGGEYLRTNVDLDMAMSWGEQYAQESAGVLVRRGARWRAGRPSQEQQALAGRLGIVVSEATSKGELSDAISLRMASWRLDAMPIVASVSERGYW